MEWGVQESERRQLPSTVVSTQAGYGLYVKHGYEEQERWEADLTNYGGGGTYFNAILTRYPKSWERR